MKDPSTPESRARERPGEAPVDQARRRLLLAGRYVAPAIIGVILLEGAGCAPTPSCGPSMCKPNTPPGCKPRQ